MTDNTKLPSGFRPTGQRRKKPAIPLPDDVTDPLNRKPQWRQRAAAQPRGFDPGRNYTSYDPFHPDNN